MSIDDQTLREALHTYADAVTVTNADVERVQAGLETRMAGRRSARTRPWLLAVAASLLLVGLVVAGAFWTSRSAPVPAGQDLRSELVGIWKVESSGSAPALMVFRQDGTTLAALTSAPLLNLSTARPVYRVNGDTLVVDGPPEIGQSCQWSAVVHQVGDGHLRTDPMVYTGTGCGTVAGAALDLTRVSPSSEAGRALTGDTTIPGVAVTGAGQLAGTWLREGTGTLLTVGQPGSNGITEFRLDSNGDIDVAPDDRGSATVTPGSDTVLRSLDHPGTCAATTLSGLLIHGTTVGATLTATVVADPCSRFGGTGQIRLLRIL